MLSMAVYGLACAASERSEFSASSTFLLSLGPQATARMAAGTNANIFRCLIFILRNNGRSARPDTLTRQGLCHPDPFGRVIFHVIFGGYFRRIFAGAGGLIMGLVLRVLLLEINGLRKRLVRKPQCKCAALSHDRFNVERTVEKQREPS